MSRSRVSSWRHATVVSASLAALLLAGVLQSPANADVTEVNGSAFGYVSMVSLFGGPTNTRPCADNATNTDCRPRPAVTLPAGGSAVPVTDSVPTGDARYGPGIIFTSGPITVSTQGTTGPTGSVTSTANIEQVNTSGVEVFTADRVASTCTASEAGVTGSTTITNGTLRTSEGDPDVEGDDTVVPVPTNPAPNTSYTGVIEGVGDSFTYIFNEQITDPATGALTVNAGHLILEGPTAVGDLYFGHVVCDVTAVASSTTTTGADTTTTTVADTTTTTVADTTTTTVADTTTTTVADTTTTTITDPDPGDDDCDPPRNFVGRLVFKIFREISALFQRLGISGFERFGCD